MGYGAGMFGPGTDDGVASWTLQVPTPITRISLASQRVIPATQGQWQKWCDGWSVTARSARSGRSSLRDMQQQRLSMAAAAQSSEVPTAASAPGISSHQGNVCYVRPRGTRAGWRVQARKNSQTFHVTTSDQTSPRPYSQQQQPHSLGHPPPYSSNNSAGDVAGKKIKAIRRIRAVQKVDVAPLVRSNSAIRQRKSFQSFGPTQPHSMSAWQHGMRLPSCSFCLPPLVHPPSPQRLHLVNRSRQLPHLQLLRPRLTSGIFVAPTTTWYRQGCLWRALRATSL